MKRKISITLLIIALVTLTSIYLCDRKIKNTAEGKLFGNTTAVPYNKVALLLGTSKFLGSGTENLYYNYRIDAACELIKNGKAKYLVISGDNGTVAYNEPMRMREDLIKRGIDSSVIFLDYAGFRTFDSVVRLRDIFGQTSVTIISQPFHNERAIYIAQREGINAVGYNAKDVSGSNGLKVQIREKLARVKVFIDYLMGTKPKFGGDRINIPS
jgi:SanA protein